MKHLLRSLIFGVLIFLALNQSTVNSVNIADRNIDNRLNFNIRSSLNVRSDIEGRITNGELAQPKQFPYQVGLMLYLDGGRAWCGGSIISDRWFLTAAHCADDVNGVDVYLGARNYTDRNEAGHQIIYIWKGYIHVHKDYDEMEISNDIALLKSPVKIEFNDYVRPVKLPKVEAGEVAPTYAGEYGIASGWGLISDAASSITDALRFIEVPVLENSVCNNYYLGSVLDSNICTSSQADKKSTCNGDSGGPLVLRDGKDNDILIGATSFGVIFGCEVGFPAAFTRITSYLDWIEQISGVV